MGLLDGKKILITGLISNRSIAYGVAQACHREGAQLAFSYAGERFKARVEGFAGEFGSQLAFECDAQSDEQIEALFASLAQSWGSIDGLVHSLAFAAPEAISGDFLDGISREAYRQAHDISAYSFAAMAKAARSRLSPNASLLTMTYLGSQRSMPNYNTMGLAKASLEACVRYAAQALGPQGARVNAISAGPIKTLAASGVKDFGSMLDLCERSSPLGRNVSALEVGNAAAFLLSDLASGVTGEIMRVDAGFSNTVPGLE